MTGRALYFWHVPKTAGTSMWAWLQPHYPPEAVYCEGLLPTFLRDAAAGALHGKQLFCGHFADAPLDLVRPRPITVTALREPVARSLSHLEQVLRSSDHPQHDRLRAHRGDIDAVLADPVLRRMLQDFQCRYLGVHHVPDRLPEDEIAWSVPPDSPLRVLMAFEMSPLPDRRRLLLRALRRLATIDHVGVTERLDVLLHEVARSQGWSAPPGAPQENTRGAGEQSFMVDQLTGPQLGAFERLCRADLVLYRAARGRAAASALRVRALER
jgi:hypothetical protein